MRELSSHATPSTSNASTSTSKPSIKANAINYFDKLTDDLVIKIFGYLTTNELCSSCARVCRRWYYLGKSRLSFKWLSLQVVNLSDNKHKKCRLLLRCDTSAGLVRGFTLQTFFFVIVLSWLEKTITSARDPKVSKLKNYLLPYYGKIAYTYLHLELHESTRKMQKC